MDDVAGERRRKGDASTPPPPSSASFPALTPRGLGLLLSSSFPSGSSFLPSPPPAADSIVLALPVSRASAAGSPAASTLLAGAMDGGGEEALLVRRSKAKKRPAPAAPHVDVREFGGAGKFLALWRDYHDLRQETEAKKRRLESKNQRKLCLLAEIKFLRRKYKSLVKQNSHQTYYKLKGKAEFRQIQSPIKINEDLTHHDHDLETRVASTTKNTDIDLNQDSLKNDERFGHQGYWSHPKLSDFDQDRVDEDTKTTDVKFTICSRDTKISPSNDDKRKISWQDRLALQA
ncbi:hypothetical protein QOZ80_6BG0489220 [Eleusine coracana subsp. coracana]|nr:hypothetical protein QOZ80_6BG0489220 [Eleusine coracana subsp. coracana]